ncbi:unnamed protein product [Ilex paraguariensis]|uniref:Zinc finger CCCH domain-containing protein 41 n=1 Tax=Ilex paraguariensis TaxID=185542 RepID=A0ABC8U3D0_9AQUA
MELKVSSPLLSDCASDPVEKEISDDDDDDRNHKHRKREAQSQSLERDALEQVLARPYRKRNKPFENGRFYREDNSQSSETWKNYNNAPLEKDLSAKFEKRRPGLAPFSRATLDVNQRFRVNHFLSGNPGPGRGRGRESGSWSQRDSRFSSIDIASQMVQQGAVPPNFLAGRGVPVASNTQSASWGSFGLVPGIPNGGLDSLHPLALHGTLGPSINPSLSTCIPRQRCRDFEERGFCLRGDMCPMEHGVNRIVIEDVQSLSQFNLPVSLPSAHMMATPAGLGPLPAISAPSSTMMNSKGLHGKSSKPERADDGLDLNGDFGGSAVAGEADFYDPDQPLWTNNRPDTSTAPLVAHMSNVDVTESLLDTEPFAHRRFGLCDGSDNEHLVRNAGTALESQSTSLSVWGRIRGAKNRSETKEKMDSTVSSSNYIESEAKEDDEPLHNVLGATRQAKWINEDGIGPQVTDSSLKTQSDTGRNVRKSSQKALRTLFVNGIPQKNNKRESLYSHFCKFGEVIDIYIPSNSERAFVQFSKREEAEAALKAPDAVMGNRFIKLWWANRDSIPDNGMSSSNGLPINHGVTAASVPSQLPVGNRGEDNLQPTPSQGRVAQGAVAPVPASGHLKPSNGPQAPPSQKKLETLELLKEEIRKKQEMLDQKRNDFRQKLNKLEKQATGLKGEAASEQAAKKQEAGVVADVAKSTTPRSTDPVTVVLSPQVEVTSDNSKSAESIVPHGSKSSSIVALQEPASLKHSIRPLTPVGASFIINRFKLDNRPTAFEIVPPLPTGLAKVDILKEHFSSYGELSAVELEDIESQEANNDSETSKFSARIFFTTRSAAERAFLKGKCWEGHNLQLMWLTSCNPRISSKDIGDRESPSSSPRRPLDGNIQPAEEASGDSQKEADLGNGESEYEERIGSDAERGETDGNFQSSSTTTSCEKQSS